METQGRHRYFSFARPEVAYAVESLANLANGNSSTASNLKTPVNGIRYCRTCYDHLAGFVGVQITEALVRQGILKNAGKGFTISKSGWDWLAKMDITGKDLGNPRRPVTRQCLDWSERRPHLAGQLGAVLLDRMLQRHWFKKIRFSRELLVTTNGSKSLYSLLHIDV